MLHDEASACSPVARGTRRAMTHICRCLKVIPLAACALMIHVGAVAAPPAATPFVIRLETLLMDLDALGVTVPPDVLLESVRAYLGAYELTLVSAVEDGARITTNSASDEEIIIGLRDAKKLSQLSARLADKCAQMRVDLFARLEAAVPPDMQPLARTCGELAALREAQHFWREAVRSTRARVPDDVSDWLRFRRDGLDATNLERQRLTRLCAINATQRAASLHSAWETLRDDVEAKAKRADELGAVGKTFHQLYAERRSLIEALSQQAPNGGLRLDQLPPDVARELMSNTSSFEPGSDAFSKLVDAQLQTYRLMEPQLTEDDRKALRLYWMPRLLGRDESIMGMPRFSASSGDPASLTREFLRTGNITEPVRERVRSLCRDWLKADAALLDSSLADLMARRDGADVTERSVELATTLRLDLAQLEGFDWLNSVDGMFEIPEAAPHTMSDADLAEFGTIYAQARAVALAADPDAALDSSGVPRLYSASESDRVATQLRLDAEQREILHALLTNARAAWETSVAPTVREGLMNTDRRNGVMNGEQIVAYYARERVACDARSRAWSLARVADDEFFRSLAAALGERCDLPALECARAARLARHMMASVAEAYRWGKAPAQVVDIATAALEMPLTDEVRATALASASSLLPAWIAASDNAVRAMRAAQIALNESTAGNLDGSDGAAQSRDQAMVALDTANARVGPALRTCTECGDGYCNAFAAALPPNDAQRWNDLLLNLRSSYSYSDARPLWRAIDTSIACVPDEQRDTVRAQAHALESELTEFNQRVNAYSALCPGRNEASYALGSLCNTQMRWMAVVIERAFPPQCREAFEDRDWLMLRKLFGRVTQSTTKEDAAAIGG